MHFQESLEAKSDLIYHSKTKEYFLEVSSSYNNGNFRSAIVMLYSVVICDLVYKIQELSDRYSDPIASDILEKIIEAKRVNSSFSQWEKLLLEEIKRTNLLEPQDKINIEYLKEHRHLSAHPVLNQMDLLFQPNREMVLSHILNMLDGVLCKSPLLSKKLISNLLEDIVSIKDILTQTDELKRFLTSKYLSKINNATEEKLFRDLWKFAFKLGDSKTNENRNVIIKTLFIIYKNKKNVFNELIKLDKSYYSDINLNDENILMNVMALSSVNPQLYNNLDESIKILLTNKGNSSVSFLAISVFLSASLEEHFEKLKKKIFDDIEGSERLSKLGIELLYTLSKEYGIVDIYLNFLIKIFTASSNYDSANYYFDLIIRQYEEQFSENQFQAILKGINDNPQIYRRKRATFDNQTLKETISRRYDTLNISEYTNL